MLTFLVKQEPREASVLFANSPKPKGLQERRGTIGGTTKMKPNIFSVLMLGNLSTDLFITVDL